MKRILFAFSFALLQICAFGQTPYTAPWGFNYAAPTGAPSALGTHLRFDITTGRVYQWSPDALNWQLQGRTIDQISGTSAPAYTPVRGQSTFAVNGDSPPKIYQYSGAGTTWVCLNCASGGAIYTAGTGIAISGTNVISNTSPDQTVVITGATGTYPNFTLPDASSTNEIQNLSLAGQALNISSGTGVTLPIIDVVAGSGISVAKTAGAATVTNTGDLSTTNEGSLTVGAGTTTTSIINSNTSGSTGVTIAVAGINAISEVDNTITVTATEIDGSVTNEIQAIANTSDATSHTATLSSTGGSVKLVEGSNITLTTTGNGLDGIVTIASSGGGVTDLTITGTTSPVTLNSSTGTDVTITAGGINTLTGTTGNVTITGTEIDGSTTNELQNLSLTGQALAISSGTGVTLPIVDVIAGTGITVSKTAGAATITNSAPDQTVVITGAGSASVSGTYPSFTVTGGGITALTGDVTATGPGSVAATIAAGAVNGAKLASGAVSDSTKVGAGAIQQSDIANGAVWAKHLARMGASTGQVLGWNGSVWGPVAAGWGLSGNAATAGSSFLGTTNNTSLRFRTNNAQRIILDSLGNVGVGLNIPLDIVHINGSGTLQAGRTWFRVQNTQTNSAAGMRFVNGDGRYAAFQYAGSSYATGEVLSAFTEGDYPISFVTNGNVVSGGTSAVIFSPGGYSNEAARFQQNRVGIGVGALPSATLHVRGAGATSANTALLVQNSTPSDLLTVRNDGKVSFWATNTTTGTTGARTIDRPSGTVNFAAGASTLVVTNSLVTTASIVFAVVRTNDTTATIKNVVPAAGSFTITLTANATAETSVGFFVIN